MTQLLARHKGGVLTTVLVLTALGAILAASITAGSLRPRAGLLARGLTPDPVTTGELRVTLTRVGLDAQSLAATGFTAQQVASVVSAAREALGESIESLRQATEALSEAAGTHDRLQALVRSGQATEQDRASFEAAQVALAAAESARQHLLDSVFAAATASFSGKRAALATVLANRQWTLAAKYLTTQRSDRDWVALRDAVHNQRVCARTGEDMDAACAQLLVSVDSSEPVATAATNLETNLALVTAAWNQTTTIQP